MYHVVTHGIRLVPWSSHPAWCDPPYQVERPICGLVWTFVPNGFTKCTCDEVRGSTVHSIVIHTVLSWWCHCEIITRNKVYVTERGFLSLKWTNGCCLESFSQRILIEIRFAYPESHCIHRTVLCLSNPGDNARSEVHVRWLKTKVKDNYWPG